jgi:cobalt-zinc-cadmium efflux system outer membrane protein
MSFARRLLLLGLLVLAGCRWPVREKTDQTMQTLALQPFDLAPAQSQPAEKKAAPSEERSDKAAPATDIQTTALMQEESEQAKAAAGSKPDLTIPPEVPGSETPPVNFEKLTKEERQRAIQRIYPELPTLPAVPEAVQGPEGRPYTLAELQKLAVENNPALRQAAADVQTAKGSLLQARTYPNPTVYGSSQPNNNNAASGAWGVFLDQPIRTFGKQKLMAAIAQKDLDNAELALRRARYDLATQVRNAYFALLVAHETVRVTRGLARFTDEIYRLQTSYLAGGFAAPYEPAALRAQAHATRLAYKQAVQSYQYAWKQLVAALGLPQLPLSQVAGRVDRMLPYYDYDAVLAYVLSRHTDILTARNTVERAQYNLKLAQITPFGDFDVQAAVFKETTIAPFTYFHTLQVGVPVPIWDQNKGNIIAAQGNLIRASEEAHRVEVTLTGNLAAAYANYKNNLFALEDYRRLILPDQVRFYRGVFERRQVDIAAQFADLVVAQQALSANVTSYLTMLGQLWTSVVNVADLLQTDDLFQLAKPHEVPPLPDLESLPRWPCVHGRAPAGACPPNQRPTLPPAPGPAIPPAVEPALPLPRRIEAPNLRRSEGGAP